MAAAILLALSLLGPTPIAADQGWNLDDDWFPEDMRSVPLDGSSRARISERQLLVARNAVKRLGTPYKLGGASLTKGIDCSHFVWKVLTMSGADCPMPPVSLMETKGKVVHWNYPVIERGGKKIKMPGRSPDFSALKMGDRMIFHRPRGSKYQTGLYLGAITYKGRKFTHAFAHASGSRGIVLEEFGPIHRYKAIYQYTLRDKWNE